MATPMVSTKRSLSLATQAANVSSFEPRYMYSSGLDTRARSAISSIEAAWYPWSEKTSTAASSICCSRTFRGSRLAAFVGLGSVLTLAMIAYSRVNLLDSNFP